MVVPAVEGIAALPHGGDGFSEQLHGDGSKRSLRQAEVFLRRKQARTTQNVDLMVWQMAKPR